MAAIVNEDTQYLDGGGSPLNAGKVYIGDVNTDPVANPKAIFSDRELSVPLANPQTLDSNGRATNKIWTDGKFSIQVNNSAEVQQFQELDNGETTTGATIIALDSVVGADTITASGGITVYTSNQQFVFVAALENTGAVTLNVDSIGAKDIVRNLSNPIVAGDFAAGASIIVIYNEGNDNFEWVNQLVLDPIPPVTAVGAVTDFAGTTAPNLWILLFGQDISRTTFSELFAEIGTTYGVGDGSTTFGLPDCRGRVTAGQDDMGGVSADRLTNTAAGGVDGDVLGGAGGEEDHVQIEAELAAHTHTSIAGASVQSNVAGANNQNHANVSTSAGGSTGSSQAANVVQPTIIFNKIIFANA